MSRPPGATVGGQVVLEGVMMRAPSGWGVAVRRPDGVIESRSDQLPSLSSRSRLARLPLTRGMVVLAESLSLGFKALAWSAQKAGDEEEEITRTQVIVTLVVAAVFAIALFVLVPVFSANLLKRYVGDTSLAFVVLDGVIRIALIVGYIWLIARSKEIKRVFEYHGAEHKTIHAYERGEPLTIESIQRYSPRHPRCGTSFIIIVGLVAFFVFLLLAPLAFVWQVIARLVLIPLIAGLSYEVLKAAAGKRWISWANRPGMWLQSITTKEPDASQVEVAVAALLAALTEDEIDELRARGPVVQAALDAEREGGAASAEDAASDAADG